MEVVKSSSKLGTSDHGCKLLPSPMSASCCSSLFPSEDAAAAGGFVTGGVGAGLILREESFVTLDVTLFVSSTYIGLVMAASLSVPFS